VKENANKKASKSIFGFDLSKAVGGADPAKTADTSPSDVVQQLNRLSKIPGGSTRSDMSNHVDLSAQANRGFIGQDRPSRARSFIQKNRNFGVGSLGEASSLDPAPRGPKGGTGTEEILDEATKTLNHQVSVRANCSKHHKFVGNSTCEFCHGASYPVAEQARLDKAAGVSRNKPRELQYQPTNSKV
jgi:hypothetical protein